MRTKIDHAKAFASVCHGDQLYGGGPHPMMKHLDDVSGVLVEFGYTLDSFPITHILAYLHDVLEDTDATMFEVEQSFGLYIAQRVYMLTDPPLSTRKERKEELHYRFRDLGRTQPLEYYDVIVVKLADRIANVSESIKGQIGNAGKNGKDLVAMYRSEYTEFKLAFFRPAHLEMWVVLDRLHNVEEN